MTDATSGTSTPMNTPINGEQPEVKMLPVRQEANGAYSMQLDDKEFHPEANDNAALCELVARRADDLKTPLLPSIDQSEGADLAALEKAAPFPIVSDHYGNVEVPMDMAAFLKSMDEGSVYEGEFLPTDLLHVGQMIKELSTQSGLTWVPLPVGKGEDGQLGG